MKKHIGKILGSLLGALIGRNIFGACIGFLLGYFADVLIGERIIKAAAQKSMEDIQGSLSPYERFIASMAGLSVYVARSGVAEERQKDTDLIRWIVSEALKLSGRDRERLDLFVEGFSQAQRVDFKALAEAYRETGLDEGGRLLMQVLLAVEGESGGEQKQKRAAVRRVARVIGISGQADSVPDSGLSQAYEILGLPENADIREVKRVYRALASQFHPDSTGNLSPEQRNEAGEAFMRIQKAYELILAEEDE